MPKVDFLVVGSGPAGQRAAIQAAKLGRRVVVVERNAQVGGVTVHTGTIPSKTLREAVLYLSGFRQRAFYGRGYRLKRDLGMPDLIERLHLTVRHEIDVIADQLARNGIEVVGGDARFLDPHRVAVRREGGEQVEFEAERFLVATGTRPVRPADVPFDDPRVLDSDGLLELKTLPRSLTVIGAGVIGLEYATMFSALDVKVAIVDGRERILPFLDRDIAADLEYLLRDRGIVLRLGQRVARIETSDPERVVTRLESGKRLVSEVVLFAAGRVGCTDRLDLEKAGLEADAQGRLAVDARYRTAQPHIFAAGDVIGFPSLASTSMEQGRLAACHAFDQATACAPGHFPFGIYAVPEISMVGKTEQELVAEGIPYETGVARLRETARGQILGLDHGLLKLLFSLEDRRLLGVHILGEGATELVHIGQAVLAHGGGLDHFLESVFNYPTLAEAYKVAALDAWNRMGHRDEAPVDLLADIPELPDARPRVPPPADRGAPATAPTAPAAAAGPPVPAGPAARPAEDAVPAYGAHLYPGGGQPDGVTY